MSLADLRRLGREDARSAARVRRQQEIGAVVVDPAWGVAVRIPYLADFVAFFLVPHDDLLIAVVDGETAELQVRARRGYIAASLRVPVAISAPHPLAGVVGVHGASHGHGEHPALRQWLRLSGGRPVLMWRIEHGDSGARLILAERPTSADVAEANARIDAALRGGR